MCAIESGSYGQEWINFYQTQGVRTSYYLKPLINFTDKDIAKKPHNFYVRCYLGQVL